MLHYSLKSSIPTESSSKGLCYTGNTLYFASNTYIYDVKDGEYNICGIVERYVRQIIMHKSLIYAITEDSLVIIYECKNIASLKCNPSCLLVSDKYIILGIENTLEVWYTPKEYKFGMFDLHSKTSLYNDDITCLAFYNDHIILSGSRDCSIKTFNIKNKKIDRLINTKSAPIKIFKIEQYTVVVCEEGQIYYINDITKKIEHKIFKNCKILCSDQFNNLIIICCADDKNSRLELIANKELIYEVIVPYEISEISFVNNNIALKGQNIVAMYNYEIDTYTFTLDLPTISCLDISNELYCVGCSDKKIRLYDDKKILKTFYDEKNTYPLLNVFFLNGSMLSLAVNGYISIFDMKNGTCFRSFSMPMKISASTVCDDGMMLFLSDCDNYKIRVIDLQRSKEIESFIGHEAPVKKLVYFGNFLFSLSTDNDLKKWNVYKSDCVTMQLEKTALDFVVRNNKIYVAYLNEIVVYDLHSEYLSSLSFKHRKPAQSIDVSFDDKLLFLGGEFNKLNIMDINTNVIDQTVKVSRNTKWKNYKDLLFKNKKESCDKSEYIEVIKLIHSKNQYKISYLSREGVFTYNWSSSKYLPLSIDLEATTDAILKYIENKKYLNAVIVALKLDEVKYIKFILETVPYEEIPAIISLIPNTLIDKLRIILINQINDNVNIIKSYTWMRYLIFYHGKGSFDQKICKKTGEIGYNTTIENIFILENLIN